MGITADSSAIATRPGLPLLAFALLAVGCGPVDGYTPLADDQDGSACRTEVAAADDAEEWTPACALENGTVQHVRLEGMGVDAGGHQASQFLLGFAAAPTDGRATTSPGQLIVQLYAGTPETLHVYYGDAYLAHEGTRDFTAEPSTLCFDLVGGSDARAPALALWISGENGAECDDFATLTAKSAWVTRDTWLDKDDTPVVGAVDGEAGAFVYQAAGVASTPVVTLFNQSVASCETLWTEDTQWQALCEPAGGATRFRVEDVEATGRASFFYIVVGEDDAPSDKPEAAAGDGKLIVRGGSSISRSSWTWFDFEGEASDQKGYSTDEKTPLYVKGKSTVCSEIAPNADGNASVLFWATGAQGADCADAASLARENALYEQAWESPLAADKMNFVKVNNSSIGLSRVVVSNDRVE